MLNEHPKGIINIVDATNIERNLYLTMQLMELDMPMVLALNMMDEVRDNGGSILVNEMEELLGIPVIPISAAKNEGIEELIDHALHVAKYQETPGTAGLLRRGGSRRSGTPLPARHHAPDRGPCRRGGDPGAVCGGQAGGGRPASILEQLELDENEKETLEHIIVQMEAERGLDRAAAIADMRFDLYRKDLRRDGGEAAARAKSISRSVTHRPDSHRKVHGDSRASSAIMALVFFLTFSVIGACAVRYCWMLGIRLSDGRGGSRS